jgi:hypothetical protein
MERGPILKAVTNQTHDSFMSGATVQLRIGPLAWRSAQIVWTCDLNLASDNQTIRKSTVPDAWS